MLTLKPYRFTPPLSTAKTAIERPRLFDMLDGRFERRLTLLRAGPGFGKTTLLCQAIAANLEDPIGIDIWFGCGPPDDRHSELSEGLLTALGVETATNSPLNAIVDAVWKESPRSVALILDDVQHLEPGGSGAAFLEQLVLSLPLNGHLVLASRDELPFPILRLMAAGEVAHIDESLLRFDSTERAEFLGDRGASQAADLGGWPAALELAARFGGSHVEEYLWEEVLAQLDPRRAQALARLASLEWIDCDRIREVAGSDLSVDELVARLPLTSTTADGTVRLHALWRPILDRLDPAWSSEQLDRAVAHLCHEENAREAIVFCKTSGQPERIVDVVRSIAGLTRWIRRSTPEIETITNELPASLRTEPIGRFMQGVFYLHTDPPSSVSLLAEARAGFREAGEVELEIGVLVAQSLIAFFAGSAEFLESLLETMMELDHPAQPQLAELCRANLHILNGQAEEALSCFDRMGEATVDLSAIDHVTAGIAALDAGRPERAMREVRKPSQSATLVMQAAIRTTVNEARWLLGEIVPDEISAFDHGIPHQTSGHMHNEAVFLAGLAFQNTTFGRVDPARTQIELLRRTSVESIGPRARMAIAAAEMAFAVLDGDLERGRAAMVSALDDAPEAVRFNRHSLRALPLLWVLDRDWRTRIDALRLGPCFLEGLKAARALVSFREGEGGAAAAGLDWKGVDRFRIFFIPSMLLELAIAAAAAGNSEAGDTARGLAEQDRATLRKIADGSNQSNDSRSARALAKEMLVKIPPRPAETLELRVLGPMSLWRDSLRVEDSPFRRDRVRAMLEYLVLHPETTRGQLGAALWPDRDERTVANNLRVNLNHLLRLLEPTRTREEPSFFIRSDGDRISLRLGSALEVDSVAFEEELDLGLTLDREGRPAEALQQLEAAIDRYRGDYFSDSAHSEWAEFDRVRLRTRFLGACHRAASLRLGKGEFQAALQHVGHAISIDHLHEPSYRLQGLIYFRSGDRNAARQALRQGIERLEADDLEPGEDLVRLYRRLSSGADRVR